MQVLMQSYATKIEYHPRVTSMAELCCPRMHEESFLWESAVLHMEELRDGRTSSESTVLSNKVLVSLCLSVSNDLMMYSPTEYKCLLETRKNGERYHLYKLKTLPEEYDASAVTYLISTIESFLRLESSGSTVFTKATISDAFLYAGEYVCVQIVAPKDTFQKENCMYWAQGSNLVTGTMILSKKEKLPYDEAHTYGNFDDNVQST